VVPGLPIVVGSSFSTHHVASVAVPAGYVWWVVSVVFALVPSWAVPLRSSFVSGRVPLCGSLTRHGWGCLYRLGVYATAQSGLVGGRAVQCFAIGHHDGSACPAAWQRILRCRCPAVGLLLFCVS